VYVNVLGDVDVEKSFGNPPMIPEKEREYFCANVRYVKEAKLSDGQGVDGFQKAIERVRPDVFYINQGDENIDVKRGLCDAQGVKVIVGDRTPAPGLLTRSTENIRHLLDTKNHPSAGDHEEGAKDVEQQAGGEVENAQLAYPRAENSKPVVFVSGCYDLLHSGHIAFFNEAATHGDLYVSIGSDQNIKMLKNHDPMFPEEERKFMVQSIKSVREARVCQGSGMLDFEADLDIIRPDCFFVNEDGHRDTKESACKARGIKYIVSTRVPSSGLPARSSTSLKESLKHAHTEDKIEDLYAFPWRICLAGGWLDQPWVSEVCPGNVIVVNVLPHEAFKTRSGLATSTRQVGTRLWGTDDPKSSGPPGNVSPLELAYFLFGAENPPGSKYIAGSQDALGLMLPGVNQLYYEGDYWPSQVTTCESMESIKWLEKVLWLVPLSSRPDGYDPLKEKHITPENVKLLADASDMAWKAISNRDAPSLGKALTKTMEAWAGILPYTVPQPQSDQWCAPYKSNSHGYLFSGCGGGFLMVISDSPVENGFQIKIKTTNWF